MILYPKYELFLHLKYGKVALNHQEVNGMLEF